MKLRADLILEEMAATFRQRNTMYGDNWIKVAKVLAALFPNGLTLQTENDFARFHFLDWTIGKFTRYVNSGYQPESIHDAAVYMAMLEALHHLQTKEDNGQCRSKQTSRKTTLKRKSNSTARRNGARR